MSDIPARILREAKSREFKASVRVGKSGLTETVLNEIRQQLQARELVKIKVNKGLFEREQRSEVWRFLAEETSSRLVLQRGNIGVLWRS
jgi:RNA-binding protein